MWRCYAPRVAWFWLILGVLVGIGGGVLVGRRSTPGAEAEREVRRLRLDLADANGKVEDLSGALVRERAASRNTGDEAQRSATDELARRVAEPLAFLSVQIHHVEAGSADGLTMADFSSTGASLVKALEESGVSCDGTPGRVATFDPDRHTAVIGTIEAGRLVRILVPGVMNASGVVVRRAVVEEG